MSKHTLTIGRIKKLYKNDDVEDQTLVRRAAHFFDWSAKHYPKQWLPWNWVYQMCLGMNRTPRNEDNQVLLLRKSASRIREILQTEYHRDLTSMAGLGARGCVDSEDTLKTEMVRKSRRVQSAITSATKTAALIDPKQIADTPENKPWKHWFSRSLSKTIEDLSSDETMKKLNAPPTNEDDK